MVNTKTLLYFAGPEQGELSNLDVFLKEWVWLAGDGAVSKPMLTEFIIITHSIQ